MIQMKHRIFAVLTLISLGALGCSAADDQGAPSAEEHAAAVAQTLQQPSTAVGTFSYPVPTDWWEETYAAPQPWAPNFPWSGTETVHFPPGWGDAASPEWWSYNYLVWVDSGPSITASRLGSALVDYYKGLVDCGGQLPCDASRFAGEMRLAARLGDISVFQGHVDSYDFSPTPVPITLNLLVTSVTCPQSRHRALLVSASPQPLSASVWIELLEAQLKFRCR